MKILIQQFSLTAAIILSFVVLASADTVKWQVVTGNWSTSTNWDLGEPVSGDDVYIRNGGTAQITGSNSEVCYDLTVGYWVGQEGTLDISGGTLTVEHYLTLARYCTGFGTVNMTGGTLSAVRQYIGDGAGTKGGVFDHSAGTNTVQDYLTIADDANSTGAYNLSGTGILNVRWGTLGNYGTATFTQTGGTINSTGTDGWFKIGRYGTGTYAISGGTMTVRRLEVTDNVSGSGTFKVTGDDATINLEWYLTRGGNGTLVSELDADGISTINASSTAALAGTWTVTDSGAVAGTYNVMVASGGFGGTTFDTVNLPNGWTWGITDTASTDTLWVTCPPPKGTVVIIK